MLLLQLPSARSAERDRSRRLSRQQLSFSLLRILRSDHSLQAGHWRHFRIPCDSSPALASPPPPPPSFDLGSPSAPSAFAYSSSFTPAEFESAAAVPVAARLLALTPQLALLQPQSLRPLREAARKIAAVTSAPALVSPHAFASTLPPKNSSNATTYPKAAPAPAAENTAGKHHHSSRRSVLSRSAGHLRQKANPPRRRTLWRQPLPLRPRKYLTASFAFLLFLLTKEY